MEPEKKTLVIIPAFNEEGSIGRVIEGIRSTLPKATILVVDDGSTDGTSERTKASGAAVLNLPFNLGMGGAMQAGYRDWRNPTKFVINYLLNDRPGFRRSPEKNG